MGLVEESADTVAVENDEMYEAADANFANDKGIIPKISNPNTIMNC